MCNAGGCPAARESKERGVVMGRYTKKELAEIKADHAYWDELGNVLGWRLHGFTGRNSGSFYTGRNSVTLGSTIYLTGPARDAIMLAINKAKLER